MPPIYDFLGDLDRGWRSTSTEKLSLKIIGSTALMLQADYERGTKDSDVLETPQIDRDTQGRVLGIAGKGSPLHRKHKIYVEFVASGLPFLPQVSRWLDVPELNRDLEKFRIEVLDVVDVVVSKLKRYHSDDRRDIEAMIDRNLVPHHRLIERFKAAVDFYADGAMAEEALPRCIRNLHGVERDMFGKEPTPIELPPWLAD